MTLLIIHSKPTEIWFFWFKEPGELNSEIMHFRFTRLVLGLRPSPALLASTIRHHLNAQVSEELREELIELLKNSLYVDDLVTGEATETTAIELSSKSKKVMHRGRFNLRKWKTNSQIVQEAISQSRESSSHQVATENTKSIAEEDESYAKATTGPSIDANRITENVTVKAQSRTPKLINSLTDLSKHAKTELLPSTKRSLLQISAKIFDPLGCQFDRIQDESRTVEDAKYSTARIPQKLRNVL